MMMCVGVVVKRCVGVEGCVVAPEDVLVYMD